MKKYKRFLAVLLLLALLVSSFASCGDSDEDENVESIFEQIVVESDSAESTETEAQSDVAEHIYVLISKNCTSSLAKRALDFVELLRVQTGLLVDLKYDNEHPNSPDGTCEILIGNTDRLETENALSMLKRDDYICRWDTGSLVICGGSDEATLKALEAFIESVLPRANRYSIMEKSATLEFIDGELHGLGTTLPESSSESAIDSSAESPNESSAESSTETSAESKENSSVESESKTDVPPVRRSTFNGFVINEFSIVYNSANEHGEKNAAEALRLLISDRSGYLLDVVSSAEINSQSGKTILVGYSKNETPAIESDGSSIIIKGNNAYNVSLAVAEFIRMMDSSTEDGVITLECKEKIDVANETFRFSVMTYFMKNGSEYDSLIELLNTLDEADDELYVIANISDKAKEYLDSNLPYGYQVYKIQTSKRELIAVYDTSTILEISSTFSEKEDLIKIDLTFENGERVTYNYFLNEGSAEVSANALERKSVGFYEGNFVLPETASNSVLAKGEVSVDSNRISYKVAAGNLLYEYAGAAKIENTSLRFSCEVKLASDVSYKLSELTDALK